MAGGTRDDSVVLLEGELVVFVAWSCSCSCPCVCTTLPEEYDLDLDLLSLAIVAVVVFVSYFALLLRRTTCTLLLFSIPFVAPPVTPVELLSMDSLLVPGALVPLVKTQTCS